MSENSVSESITDETWRDAYREHLIQGGLSLDAAEAIAANPALTRETWDRTQGSGTASKARVSLEKPAAPKKPRKSGLSLEKPPLETKPKLTLEKSGEVKPKKKLSLEKEPLKTEPKPRKPRKKEKEEPGPLAEKRRARIVNIGTSIATTEANETTMLFQSAILCHVGFPRSEIAERSFMRKSGDAWIYLQAGMLDEGRGPVEQPVPYGVTPRLVMAHLSTFAIRNKSREIPIGKSEAEFLRKMGIPDSQGARYDKLRQQLHALAACRIQMGYHSRTLNSHLLDQFDTWSSSPAGKGEQRPWSGVLTLSESYFNDLQANGGVPLDSRALHGLTGSALALDIYMWLAHRLHRIGSRPVILHWRSLREQFGQEYNDPKNFKKAFVTALQRVQTLYPSAKVKVVAGGLMLMASPPPIPLKNGGQI